MKTSSFIALNTYDAGAAGERGRSQASRRSEATQRSLKTSEKQSRKEITSTQSKKESKDSADRRSQNGYRKQSESTKKASDEMKCFLRKIGSKKRDGELKLRQFLTTKTADRKSKELKFKTEPKHKELIEKKTEKKEKENLPARPSDSQEKTPRAKRKAKYGTVTETCVEDFTEFEIVEAESRPAVSKNQPGAKGKRRRRRKRSSTKGDSIEPVENKAAEGSARQGAPEDSGSTRNAARSAENANVSGRKETHSDRPSASIRSAELMRSSSKNDKKSTERSSDRKHPEKKKCDVSHKKSSGKGTEQKTASPPTADSASDSHSQETTSKPSEHQTRKIKSKETSCTQSEHEEEERSVALYMVANNLQQRPPVEKRSHGRPPRSSRMDKEEVESSYYLW